MSPTRCGGNASGSRSGDPRSGQSFPWQSSSHSIRISTASIPSLSLCRAAALRGKMCLQGCPASSARNIHWLPRPERNMPGSAHLVGTTSDWGWRWHHPTFVSRTASSLSTTGSTDTGVVLGAAAYVVTGTVSLALPFTVGKTGYFLLFWLCTGIMGFFAAGFRSKSPALPNTHSSCMQGLLGLGSFCAGTLVTVFIQHVRLV